MVCSLLIANACRCRFPILVEVGNDKRGSIFIKRAAPTLYFIYLGDMAQYTQHVAGITIFIVVEGNDLDESAVDGNAGSSIKNGRM